MDVSRLTIQAGKFSVGDVFDGNAYAKDTRKDFMNWSIWAPGAFDYAADKLGLTYGVTAELNQKQWALRAGYFLIDAESNSNNFDTQVFRRGQYVAELETDFDPSLPPVYCQPGEFNQVILNLIVNAAHAIGDVVKKGGPEKGLIRVRTRGFPGYAEIRIEDSGTGIPQDARARVFDPFFTTKEVGKGTGQGLAIARSVVVDKHGGSIHFETELGKGTTFIIRLPYNGKAIAVKGVAA